MCHCMMRSARLALNQIPIIHALISRMHQRSRFHGTAHNGCPILTGKLMERVGSSPMATALCSIQIMCHKLFLTRIVNSLSIGTMVPTPCKIQCSTLILLERAPTLSMLLRPHWPRSASIERLVWEDTDKALLSYLKSREPCLIVQIIPRGPTTCKFRVAKQQQPSQTSVCHLIIPAETVLLI